MAAESGVRQESSRRVPLQQAVWWELLAVLAIFLLALYSFNPLRKPVPIMIDLTLDAGPVAVKTASLPQPPAPRAPLVRHQATRVVPREVPPVQPAPPVAAAPVITPSARAVPDSLPPPVPLPRSDASPAGRGKNSTATPAYGRGI